MTSPRGILAAAIAAVPLLSAGCAGGLAGSRKSPGVVVNDTFKPAKAPAANYGPDPALTCPDRGVNGIVSGDLGNAARPEGRLCAIAETLLGWPGTDKDIPPETVLTVISNDFGLPQPARRIVITQVNTIERGAGEKKTEGATDEQLASMIESPIRTFAESATAPRYGLMTERVKAGVTKVVIVMQDQNFEMKPLPRKLNPGQTATLSGTVLGDLNNPKVQYTDPVGKLEKAEGSGKTFSADLKCGDHPGRMIVRLAAEKEGADVLLANFPVGCGVELPVAAAMPVAGQQAGPGDPAAAEKQLAQLLNQDRSSAGLKPLKVDDNLAKVARTISDNRAKGKGTSSQEVQRLMEEQDISAPLTLVSEAQATNADDAWMRISNSPADRSNAMNPDVTDVGIGVAPAPAVPGAPATMIVTQLYVKQLPPPNAEEVKSKLYDAIATRRSDARAPAVTKDSTLERIAQEYASALAKEKGKVPKEKVAEIEAPLYKSFSTVNEIGGLKADPLEFAQEPGVVTDAKLVGIGVGVGPSQQFGKNSTYVVILMGKAKAPAAASRPVKKKTKK